MFWMPLSKALMSVLRGITDSIETTLLLILFFTIESFTAEVWDLVDILQCFAVAEVLRASLALLLGPEVSSDQVVFEEEFSILLLLLPSLV